MQIFNFSNYSVRAERHGNEFNILNSCFQKVFYIFPSKCNAMWTTVDNRNRLRYKMSLLDEGKMRSGLEEMSVMKDAELQRII